MSGILLFSAVAVLAVPPDLAVDLFAEGDWVACRRECRRVLAEDPEQQTAQLLDAVARLRLGEDRPEIVDSLARLAAVTGSVETSSMAAYELGRAEWKRAVEPTPRFADPSKGGDGSQAVPSSGGVPGGRGGLDDAERAFDHLRQAFMTAPSRDLFLRAGCSMDLLRRDFPARRGASPTLGKNDPALLQSLETCRPLWTPDLRKECAIEPVREGARLLSKPGEWIVRFYRAQLRPAIGARCSLEPNCSEYFREAGRAHGLLAFPITADRLVREPSVVAAKKKEVQVGERTRIADPLSDHDGLMKR